MAAKRLANFYANFQSSQNFLDFSLLRARYDKLYKTKKLFYCKFFIRYFCRKRKTRRKVFDIKNAINLNENFQQILQAKVVLVQCWLVRSCIITCSSQSFFLVFDFVYCLKYVKTSRINILFGEALKHFLQCLSIFAFVNFLLFHRVPYTSQMR